MENKKRKRGDGQSIEPIPAATAHDEILQMESRIQESRQNYNEIVKLLDYFQNQHIGSDSDIIAAVALCRVFCRLIVARSMSKSHEMSEQETTVVLWLQARYQEYNEKLLAWLKSRDTVRATTALTLLMKLFKDESLHFKTIDSTTSHDGTLSVVLQALVDNSTVKDARRDFVDKYFRKFDDIRHYTLTLIS